MDQLASGTRHARRLRGFEGQAQVDLHFNRRATAEASTEAINHDFTLYKNRFRNWDTTVTLKPPALGVIRSRSRSKTPDGSSGSSRSGSPDKL